MKIAHVAIWCLDLESMRSFYEEHFGASASAKYRNGRTGFESFFLHFDEGAALELMGTDKLARAASTQRHPSPGLAHIAIGVGPEAEVDARTADLRRAGVEVVSEPRRTGDGYYESVVLDPEGNRIEIVATP